MSKQSDLFGLIDQKEEHTAKRILERRIKETKEEVIISQSDKEKKRRKELIEKLRVDYNKSIILFTGNGFVLDTLVFDRCCCILEDSYDINVYDCDLVSILKDIIQEQIHDTLYLLYIYSMPQSDMMRFVSEYYNYVEEYDPVEIVDRSYSEAMNEIRRKERINGKNS